MRGSKKKHHIFCFIYCFKRFGAVILGGYQNCVGFTFYMSFFFFLNMEMDGARNGTSFHDVFRTEKLRSCPSPASDIEINVAQGWHLIVLIHNLDESHFTKFPAYISEWEEGSLFPCRFVDASLCLPLPNPLE